MQQEPHGAALGVQRGSEPGELTSTEPKQQLHAVDLFADWMTSAERPLRIRIYRARDRMLASSNRSKHDRARSIYWFGSQMAADWAFRRASEDDLREVLAALTRIFMVADAIERLEAPDDQQ